MVSRGASRAVMRAMIGDAQRLIEMAECSVCGSLLDFEQPDPDGIGRTMQRCTNVHCPEHRLRPVVTRHV